MTEDTIPTLPEMNSLWRETLDWAPTPSVRQQFQRLYELIVTGNRQVNLTRITEPTAFWEKHLWDSLRGIAPILQQRETAKRAIDIGTGAGLPGIPVAIACADMEVTLLDSRRKKMVFVDRALDELGLGNATTVVGRAEQVAKQNAYRDEYDLVLVRAVGSVSACVEYALPFLGPNGLAVLYRGRWSEEDALSVATAAERLGGAIESVDGFTTPLTHAVRHCASVRRF